MAEKEFVEKLIASRKALAPKGGFVMPADLPAEGGCGVIGMASSEQLAARHMFQSLQQMRNRGNGKGGGIAAAGLVAGEWGVSQQVLENDYLLVIAYLDSKVRPELEKDFIYSVFDVDHVREQPAIASYRDIEELDVRPPDVVSYFVRLKSKVVQDFIDQHGMQQVSRRRVEDEIVYQNSYKLNTAYYESTGDKKAFVLSHGKNLLVLKMVGYGDDVIRYYRLEDTHAHVWIGHHRYPTKGRVWHPGGAHPFIGLNEALVHNGDFANHASISEYLAQRNIYPLFLTDTEVAVQVFDLLHRGYDYPLEYTIEALAPTTERDFAMLPDEKKRIYHMLQSVHMHASPDGPWFFLIAQSDTHAEHGPVYRLTGITDTSMLRPQVFAWQEAEVDGRKVSIGFAASEKQGIDAALESLSKTDPRFWRRADRYWNARGGSHTDGGAFAFSVTPDGSGGAKMVCTDKFGKEVNAPITSPAYIANGHQPDLPALDAPDLPAEELFAWFLMQLPRWGYAEVIAFLRDQLNTARQAGGWSKAIQLLTLMLDRRCPSGNLRRSSLLALYDASFAELVEAIKAAPGKDYHFHQAGEMIPAPLHPSQTVVFDARQFTPEDETSAARELQRLYAKGFRRYLIAHTQGHRFLANGLGGGTQNVRMDVYGSPGDYLGSGLDGLEMHVHNNGQDQMAQIMKAGKLVVHGDVGQTFMYGAKGGEAYILGNAAGRPLINAVGRPRVVINGTCLDYLAESFMAGDPLDGGGFVILNGIAFDEAGRIVDLPEPYPGSNLFSLASGGAIYVRDPHELVTGDQLNGGEFAELTPEDWALIEPYLLENERLFHIPVRRLLTVDGEECPPRAVYRKIQPRRLAALIAEEEWMTEGKR